MARKIKPASPQDVRDIQEKIKKFYDTEDGQGREIGNAFCGIYAFYDLGPAHKREKRFVGIAPNPSNSGKTP